MGGSQKLSDSAFCAAFIQCARKGPLSCVLPAADPDRISMRRLWHDAGRGLYSDRPVCERNAAQSRGAALDFISGLVFRKQVSQRRAAKTDKSFSRAGMRYYACGLCVQNDLFFSGRAADGISCK